MGLNEIDAEITKYEKERSHARNKQRNSRIKSNERYSVPQRLK